MSEAATTTSIVSLAIDGMSSRACVARLERALSNVPAVIAVNVRLESDSAKVELADMQTEAAAIAAVEALIGATASLGFEAHLRGYEGPPVSAGPVADDIGSASPAAAADLGDAGTPGARSMGTAATAAAAQGSLTSAPVPARDDGPASAWQHPTRDATSRSDIADHDGEHAGRSIDASPDLPRAPERPHRRFRETPATRHTRIEPEFGPDLSSPTEPDLHGWSPVETAAAAASPAARPGEPFTDQSAQAAAATDVDRDTAAWAHTGPAATARGLPGAGASVAAARDSKLDPEPGQEPGHRANAVSPPQADDFGPVAEETLVVLEREVREAAEPVTPERVGAAELAALAEVAHTADDDNPNRNAVPPSYGSVGSEAAGSGARSTPITPSPRLVEPGRVSLSGKTVIISCASLTAILLLPMLGRLLGLPGTISPSLQFSLATVVMLLAGSSVARTAWQALRDGRTSVDLLAVAGSLSAWLLSIWLWSAGRSGDGLYFETAAGVATLALAGQYLVYRTRRRAQDALDELALAQPDIATEIISVEDDEIVTDGDPDAFDEAAVLARRGADPILRGRPIRERELPAEDLVGGEIVMIRPGDRIPADAIILSGQSPIDESVLTGDATPVDRGQGEPVFAGTLNGAGRLFARVERVGPDTTLARVLTRIEDAQASRTQIERKVDRAIGWLVPGALLLAALTCGFWLWQGAGAESAVARAIAVLVVAFPCALGLAAPAALIAGTRAAARSGILMRDAGVIETLPTIRTCAFEQTGSLTEGRPGVRAIVPAPGIDRESLLAVTAAIEEQSAHPLAEAVQRFADGAPAIGDAQAASTGHAGVAGAPAGADSTGNAQAPTSVLHVEAEAVRPIEGAGIEGRVRFPGAADHEAVPVFIGSEALMLQQGVDLTPLAEELEIARNDGWTISLVAMARADSDPMLLGAVLFADTPRAGARSAVEALRKAGIAPVMLSPEPANAARSTGATLGIDETIGELEPQGVDGWIQRARESGRGVAMVGDAIDDAETLVSADIGVAMSSDSAGRDVAIDTAPLTLMRDDVRLVPAAFDIGRRTYGNLRQNLGWALVFNAVGIPLAAIGVLTPFAAVVAIGAGMLFVQGNALRLGQWKPDRDIAPF